MMNAKIRAIRAEFLGCNRQVDGLQQDIGCRSCLRMRGIGQWPNERKPIFFMSDVA